MTSTTTHSLTRNELYDLVWSTPMRTLARKFNISDVGLAKVCKKHGIPRPSVGYWARIQHGQKPKKEALPKPPENSGEIVRFTSGSSVATEDKSFFDEGLADLAARIERGELVVPVAATLRGQHELTSRTRAWLEHQARPPKRDQWGGIEHLPAYEGSYVAVSVGKGLEHRALLLLDAAIKTLDAIGCQSVEPVERWNRTVAFKFKDTTFSIRISERSRQVEHVLTKHEQEQKKRLGRHWGPAHDYVPTQELRLDLTYAHGGTAWSRFKDGKFSKIESALPRFVMAVLRHADGRLKWIAMQKEQARIAAEQARLAREAEERRRREEAIRKAEADRRTRLFAMAAAWRQHHDLAAFLAECERRATDGQLPVHEQERVQQWIAWAKGAYADADPFLGGVASLARTTHPDRPPEPKASDRQQVASKSEASAFPFSL